MRLLVPKEQRELAGRGQAGKCLRQRIPLIMLALPQPLLLSSAFEGIRRPSRIECQNRCGIQRKAVSRLRRVAASKGNPATPAVASEVGVVL